MSPEKKAQANDNRWFRLDNAAKIYPPIRSARRAGVFRVAAVLKAPVNPETLQKALNVTLSRFPSFNVRMRKGLFWYYFEHNPNSALVTPEKAPVCRPVDLRETKGYLFRVSYYGCRISLEIFHAIADGTGAMIFLKALVYNYLALSGAPVEADEEILDGQLSFAGGEVEDSFLKYYNEKRKAGRAEETAYQMKGTRLPPGYVRITQGIIPVEPFKVLAKESGATLTEYMAALLILAVYESQLKGRGHKKPVKVSVPVNLRNFFPSGTLRNFSSYINVGLAFNGEEADFDVILSAVREQLRNDATKEKLIEKIGANVSAERSPFMRVTPLFMKNLALKTAYSLYGERLVTTTLSNLGVVSVPESMREHIKRFEFLLGAPRRNTFSCAVCSFGGQVTVSFTRVVEETDIERFFFRYLAKKGLDITIESNYGALL
jgi:NRPS condensation-like uncharacterized protein